MTQQKSKASTRQTIEQERGREAWKDIQTVKDIASDYRALARGLNAMIQVNGLGQTLGFFYAKSIDAKTGKPDPQKAHYRILHHLTNWMKGHFTTSVGTIGGEYNGLLSWVIDEATSTSDYRRATTECLAFGRWLSRFAEAELSDNTRKVEDVSKGAGNG